MKTAVLATMSLALTLAWRAGGGDAPSLTEKDQVAERAPNSGPVDDAAAALQIGRAVLRHLLPPDDVQKKACSEAGLKDGIWTVTYWEPKVRINMPIVIRIRQKTGAIIAYEDPNV